ncbi:hypothetical protein COCC4DRAFT_48204 [Bipolaris maydis ATCC 48331]|uniref:Rhodopsin domain-containing protein n=2 Tax=Cochliobolus heterostrophus TaxID=5016 RepID=M2UWV2_COCH5|nr:uncharacterized protein COCC4DRAFT_48204 [Bipolaris maydis ATCC 48331]EMD92293.1 hypothetical protein COCHEDRAFT_1224144 [Bipolaris maydis C5]ENI07985.1 hypothetical protein COCC4DRAFT_48204 [Bipolaris maydis ATCC 48331]KAJ6210092.1 hypothetical protein PSV09DRAFT_1224144 [Bipolaris maydis]
MAAISSRLSTSPEPVMTHAQSPSWFVIRSKATADIGYDALVPTVIFTALAFVMVILRLCSRTCSNTNRIGLEDYFITAALLLSMGFTAVIGQGKQVSIDIADPVEGATYPASLPAMLKLVLAQAILYHLASNLVKASLILQYIRLFSLIPHVLWSCYALLILVSSATAWGMFGNVFLCRPIRSYWDVTVPGVCMNKEQHFWSTSIIGIVVDVAIWMLPLPVIGRLSLPKRQKNGLLFVFGLGGFVCIITILRLALVRYAMVNGQVTRCGTFAIVFSSIEINVAIICASLLVMKPLLARFLPYIISEQPLSAAEDGRASRALTSTHMLRTSIADAAEKRERRERNDTLVEMNRSSG